jgi:regulator of protease activity HflC (stomatin/prohibitin superfamily)
MSFFVGVFAGFVTFLIGVPMALFLARLFGLYAVVDEGTCHVYTLFGNVIGVLREPGLVILPQQLGPAAFIARIFGKRYVIDLRLDQAYLRSQTVNSEEGAPMGVGLWYEMFVSDPISYLFKNADPRGSLAANVGSATVRSLSNMPLAELLEDRHRMSRTVREEVLPQSNEWGYGLGSVYVRKVHFRDDEMIRQIEAKVVNRLRQVTSAIKQDGANQVSVITSSAERTAAVEFAKAQAIRPALVGKALSEIELDRAVSDALFELLEIQRLLAHQVPITLLPSGGGALGALLAARPEPGAPSPRKKG